MECEPARPTAQIFILNKNHVKVNTRLVRNTSLLKFLFDLTLETAIVQNKIQCKKNEKRLVCVPILSVAR